MIGRTSRIGHSAASFFALCFFHILKKLPPQLIGSHCGGISFVYSYSSVGGSTGGTISFEAPDSIGLFDFAVASILAAPADSVSISCVFPASVWEDCVEAAGVSAELLTFAFGTVGSCGAVCSGGGAGEIGCEFTETFDTFDTFGGLGVLGALGAFGALGGVGD